MKKLFILIAFCFSYLLGTSQTYPITQNLGSPNTLVNGKGGEKVDSTFIMPIYADTTAANLTRTKLYVGSIIYTTLGNGLWQRNVTASAWTNLRASNSGICQGLNYGGIVTWSSGLTFLATAANYCISNNTYNAPSTSLTLATADPSNARYDVFIADTSSTIKVITGTPSADPVIPQINPATQVFLAYVRVNAGATTPSGVSREVIYNENVEWTATSSLLGGSVNFANTNFPYIGTIAADIASGTSGTIQFTKSDTININDYNVFQMFVRLKAAFSAFTNIQVAFTLGGSPVSNYITLDNTTGFIKTTVGSYQNISIGVPAFLFSSTQIDGLQLRLTGTNGGFYLDYVQLQNGIIPPNQDYDNRYVKLYIADTILAVKTLGDSLVLNNSAPASAVTSVGPPSVPVSWRVNTRDTLAGASIVGEMNAYIQGRRGSSTPNFDWFLQSKNSGIKGLTVNTDGTVTTGNGLIFNATSRITSPTTITLFGNSTSVKTDFVNFGQPLAAAGSLIRGRSGNTSGSLARILTLDGDANLPTLYAFTAGTVASGTANPSLNAQMDIVSVGKGVIFPRMTTAQRDGIPKRVATVTITNGGAGMIAAPTITATTTGIAARFTGTISGGVLTAITIDYGGTNYTAGGSLIIDTTGTNATVLPIATYTVTTDTIPTALMIYNTDSLCYQSYNGSAWVNMREGSGGGGGGSQDLSSVLGFGNTASNFMNIDSLKLYDNPNDGYGSLSLSDNQFSVKNYLGNNILIADNNTALLNVFKTNGISWVISDVGDSLTASRNYQVPNKDGVLALTSDISPDTLVIQNYPLQSAVVGATIEQSINQDFLDSVRNNLQRTYTGIDLTSADYNITGPGIYLVEHGSSDGSHVINLPNPSLFAGGQITIINSDGADNYDAPYGTNKPKQGGSSADWTTLLYQEMIIVYSIGGNWRGGGVTIF